MSEFASAVTAVEMAVKALGLEGQISVEMDSEAQTIILDEKAAITFPGGNAVEALSMGFTSTSGTYIQGPSGVTPTRLIVSGTDVVEAVVEAVAHVVSEQARGFLHTIFETVEDDIDDE